MVGRSTAGTEGPPLDFAGSHRPRRAQTLGPSSRHGGHLVTDAPRVGPSRHDLDKLGDIAAAAGLRRIAILAWRDLDDPEAGGSEIHAARIAALWGQAGIEVTMRTSHAPGSPQVS